MRVRVSPTYRTICRDEGAYRKKKALKNQENSIESKEEKFLVVFLFFVEAIENLRNIERY